VNLTVRGHRVLVQTLDQSMTEAADGLIVVHAYAPDVMGTIVAVGDVSEVAPGDVVIFPPSAGQVVEYQDTRYLSMTEDEILAVVEDESHE